MLIGNKKNFAIEIEILEIVDGWIFGTFIFWVSGVLVGSEEDKSVDLKGCISWLKEFIAATQNRFEPGLYELNKDEIYIQLCESVLVEGRNTFANERYKDTFSRFHISHIGMSSFDDVTMVLVENNQGDVRFIWKQDDQDVEDAFFKKSDICDVVASAIIYFEGNS